jgi:hypothetical protein
MMVTFQRLQLQSIRFLVSTLHPQSLTVQKSFHGTSLQSIRFLVFRAYAVSKRSESWNHFISVWHRKESCMPLLGWKNQVWNGTSSVRAHLNRCCDYKSQRFSSSFFNDKCGRTCEFSFSCQVWTRGNSKSNGEDVDMLSGTLDLLLWNSLNSWHYWWEHWLKVQFA